MSKSTSFRVSNDSPQAEHRAVLKNDRRVQGEIAGTYFGAALSEVGTVGGRYAAEGKTQVIGSGPVQYPRQPGTSPWSADPVGQEPALGYSVDEMPVTGEFFEVQQSLCDGSSGAAPPPASLPTSPGGSAQRGEAASSPGSPSAPLPPKTPRRKRRV